MPNAGNEIPHQASPGSVPKKPAKALSFGSVVFIGIILYGTWQIVSTYLDEWFSGSELTAEGYAVIAKDYPALSEKTKQVIDFYLDKGYLAVRDTTPIYSAMLNDLPSVELGPGPDLGDPKESLNHVIYRRIMGIPTQSKGKDLMMQHRQQ
jgi:hypothetical protein